MVKKLYITFHNGNSYTYYYNKVIKLFRCVSDRLAQSYIHSSNLENIRHPRIALKVIVFVNCLLTKKIFLKKHHLTSDSIILIGKIPKLRPRFAWFTTKFSFAYYNFALEACRYRIFQIQIALIW